MTDTPGGSPSARFPDLPRAVLTGLTHGVFVKDRDLRLLAVNPAFCAAVGRTESELLGHDDFDLYPRPLAALRRVEERAVLADGARRETLEEHPVGGQTRTLHVVRAPLLSPGGEVEGVLGVLWDVTEQRRLEERQRHAQKMETVGQLAGGIAHDFNNLLTGVVGNLALARAELARADTDPQRLLEYLDRAEDISRRAADLTRQLLGFARRMESRPEVLDLNRTVRETLRALRPTLGAGVQVELETDLDLWAVRADDGQLARLLTNLCLNARDAMPHGGRLIIETSNVTLDGDEARQFLDGRPGEFVCLRVSDTGEGIAPEVLPRIFEPFFTTRGFGKGIGLGLAMVFGIVKDHQGWVCCASEVGRGSRFAVYLPRCPAAGAV
jgi:PAS domain S-box-containing protein